VGTAHGYEVVRCSCCGTLYTARLPASTTEAIDYAGYYDPSNLTTPPFVERRLDQVAGMFERYRQLGRWLDVGCGRGELLRVLTRRGWHAVGTELASAAAEALRRAGLEVHLGRLDEIGLDDQSFDVVSMVEVLEHVEDPGTLLRDARRLLRPGGAIYLTTPHGRGLSARALGTRWSVVVPPEHLQLYSVRGLERLLERSGLQVKAVRTHAVNPHELMLGLARRREVTVSERKQTGYRLNESLSERRLGAAAKAGVNSVLSVLRLGDSVKVTAERLS
jgi:SAM-dependent methyltransferase